MKMHLLALTGLAIASAVFSGCANGHSTSTSGQQQNTSVNSHARSQGVDSPVWVDWTKPAKSQSAYEPGGMPRYGIGMP
jgi:ABC-type oligopeptide transport system substrate-binding subunit